MIAHFWSTFGHISLSESCYFSTFKNVIIRNLFRLNTLWLNWPAKNFLFFWYMCKKYLKSCKASSLANNITFYTDTYKRYKHFFSHCIVAYKLEDIWNSKIYCLVEEKPVTMNYTCMNHTLFMQILRHTNVLKYTLYQEKRRRNFFSLHSLTKIKINV